jgi:predicted DNA-binding transcriptional regulator AlpA
MSKFAGLPEYLSRNDLAALLDVHLETIKRLEREGKLPAPVRITSKLVRYDKAVIEKFLQDAASRK